MKNYQIRKHVGSLMLESAIREEAAGRKSVAKKLMDSAAIIADDAPCAMPRFHEAREDAFLFAARAAQDLFGAGEDGFSRVRGAL